MDQIKRTEVYSGDIYESFFMSNDFGQYNTNHNSFIYRKKTVVNITQQTCSRFKCVRRSQLKNICQSIDFKVREYLYDKRERYSHIIFLIVRVLKVLNSLEPSFLHELSLKETELYALILKD